jgi:hypothetical protein
MAKSQTSSFKKEQYNKTIKESTVILSKSQLSKSIAKDDSISQRKLQGAKNIGSVNNKKLLPEYKSKFIAAIRLRNELSLTQIQIDSLMYHANRLNELRLANSYFFPKVYERKVLPRILKDVQYTTLLVNLNTPLALRKAKTDWKEIKLRGLKTNEDSVMVVNEMMSYWIGKFSIIDRYITDDKTISQSNMSESMKVLITPEPQAMKLLETARTTNNNPIQGPLRPAFRW